MRLRPIFSYHRFVPTHRVCLHQKMMAGMDSLLDDSVFDIGEGSDFSPPKAVCTYAV